jgi:hypothetical protein
MNSSITRHVYEFRRIDINKLLSTLTKNPIQYIVYLKLQIISCLVVQVIPLLRVYRSLMRFLHLHDLHRHVLYLHDAFDCYRLIGKANGLTSEYKCTASNLILTLPRILSCRVINRRPRYRATYFKLTVHSASLRCGQREICGNVLRPYLVSSARFSVNPRPAMS